MGITLFGEKEDCCACGACLNVCPEKAIEMKTDEYGFLYPHINPQKCVECGACKKACKFREYKLNPVKNAYAATIRDEEQIMKAASGGVFSAAAMTILAEGGIVFGATLTFEDGHANPHHIMIEDKADLYKLQGSKYVQSSIGDTYQEAKKYLKQGQRVLFSGTPCQIVGLRSYLGKEYENLYTMDLICHGVPSIDFFDGYIQKLSKRYHGKVIQYRFRDKTKGWGMNTSIMIQKEDRKITIHKPARTQSYVSFFLDCKIYRESCYSCPYASSNRVGDITIGDYWGVEKAHPELVKEPAFEEKKGVSCLLVNTAKGQELLGLMQDGIHIALSEFEKVAERNGQLKSSSVMPAERQQIMGLFQNKGYGEIERYFHSKYRKQIIVHTIYNMIPRKLRFKLKEIFKG